MAKKCWTSFERFEFWLTLNDAHCAHHQGDCDDDVRALSLVPYIAEQLATIDPAELREELRGYGAWDDAELADHAQNLRRALWLGAGDIIEEYARELDPECN